MFDLNRIRGRGRCALCLLPLMCLMSVGVLWAKPAPTSADPMVEALKEIETADWDNRWLGYGIALAGSAVGLGVGAWALDEQPVSGDGGPDPIVLASSLVIAGSAMTQIVHGGMRYDERVIGATEARSLLADEKARAARGLFFLRNRAAQARSTRFWGGLMTTAQGLGTTTLGVRLWTKTNGGLRTTGIVLTAAGV